MHMYLPKKIILSTGVGFGLTELTALDAALLDAGVGNYNLVNVSSIIPPGAGIFKFKKKLLEDKPIGSLLPVVYTYAFSKTINQNIISGIACGLSKSIHRNGVIFELSGSYDQERAQEILNNMLNEAGRNRNCLYDQRKYIFVRSCYNNKIACTVATAILI